MLIAIVSTLISSVALLGVAVSLVLQARQLRANQVQTARASQVELMRTALENPTVVAEALGAGDCGALVRGVVLNWYLGHLSMSYDIKTLAKPHLRQLARDLFAVEGSRTWWETARLSYGDDVTSRRQRDFFALVDAEFQQIARPPESAIKTPGTETAPDPAAPSAG